MSVPNQLLNIPQMRKSSKAYYTLCTCFSVFTFHVVIKVAEIESLEVILVRPIGYIFKIPDTRYYLYNFGIIKKICNSRRMENYVQKSGVVQG